MDQPSPPPSRWRPLERHERRAVGVLAEKAKTTPDAYPMTLNALVNGCNQKSNRFPLMQLDEAQVDSALESLRKAGAVVLIQGDSRVEKFRHMLYEWLGVDKAELAVMTELLLRGAQTLGELRGRAARMEPFADLGALLPVVDSLKQKGLLIYLTPPGRGSVVTHNLYQPQELAKVKADVSASAPAGDDAPPSAPGSARGPTPSPAPPSRPHESVAALPPSEIAALRRELAELREQTDAALDELRREIADLKSQLGG